MSKGGNIKQWNIGQETIAQGDRDLGLEDIKEGRKSPVTVVVKEEQEMCFEHGVNLSKGHASRRGRGTV